MLWARKPDRYCCSFGRFARDRKSSPMHFRKRFCQGKSQPGPLKLPREAGVDLTEWRKRDRDILRIHSNTGIADLEQHAPIAFLGQVDPNTTFSRGEFSRI